MNLEDTWNMKILYYNGNRAFNLSLKKEMEFLMLIKSRGVLFANRRNATVGRKHDTSLHREEQMSEKHRDPWKCIPTGLPRSKGWLCWLQFTKMLTTWLASLQDFLIWSDMVILFCFVLYVFIVTLHSPSFSLDPFVDIIINFPLVSRVIDQSKALKSYLVRNLFSCGLSVRLI